MMLGAFGALFAIEKTNMALFPAILIALVVAGLISLLMEVSIYRPMRQKKALKVYLMIAALGINTCVPNFCIQVWGGAVRPFPSGWAKAVIRIGGVVVPRADVLAAVLSVIMLVLLWCFLFRTKLGLGIRGMITASVHQSHK